MTAAIVAFGACSSPPREPAQHDLPSGQAPAVASQASTLSGRLALSVEAHEGRPAQGFNASFELQRRGSGSELLLSAATGQRLARLSWQAGGREGVELDTAERGVQRFASLSALSRQMFGEDLPLALLPEWLAGRPAADPPSIPQQAGFIQAGWTLDLSRLPDGLIVARRELPPSITLRVRLDAE